MSQGKDSTACGKGAFSTAQRAEGNDASHRRDTSYGSVSLISHLVISH